MPLEMPDTDGDDLTHSDWGRSSDVRSARRARSWRLPKSAWGRAFLALAALTVLGGLAISAFLLKTCLERDARFRIAGAESIAATGLTEVSRAEMLPVFGEDIGRNIFFVPLSQRRKQLEEIPWVERATVMRVLPDRIRVSVVERQPVAFTRQGQQVGLVDANGVLLTMPAAMMAQHHYSFPVVTGIDAHDPLLSRKTRMAVYRRLLSELDSTGERLSEQISEIDLTDPEDARVLMPEPGADVLAHFGEDRFLERYRRYKAHIAEWKQQYPKLGAVDLRYDQQVVLEMAHGGNAVEAAPADPAAAGASAGSELKAGLDKTPAAASANHAESEAASNSTQPAIAAAGKEPVQPAVGAKAPKPGAKASAKPRTAKERAHKKKRAAAKRATLNASKRKTVPTTPPAADGGRGQ